MKLVTWSFEAWRGGRFGGRQSVVLQSLGGLQYRGKIAYFELSVVRYWANDDVRQRHFTIWVRVCAGCWAQRSSSLCRGYGGCSGSEASSFLPFSCWLRDIVGGLKTTAVENTLVSWELLRMNPAELRKIDSKCTFYCYGVTINQNKVRCNTSVDRLPT